MALKRVGCTSLSRCGLVIGWIIGSISLFYLVIVLAYLYGYTEDLLQARVNLVKEMKRNNNKKTSLKYEIYRVERLTDDIVECSILSGMLLMIFITSILLIIGVKKRKQYFVLSWVLSLIIFFIYILIKLPSVCRDYGVFIIFPIGFVAYLWYIIFSIYVKCLNSNYQVDNVNMNDFQGNFENHQEFQEIEPYPA